MKDIQFIIIDLFCGAGGTTTGFEQALHLDGDKKIAKVIACVNHDPVAIKSHWANHPEVEHYEEDITMLYGLFDHGVLLKSAALERLIRLVNLYRAFYPNAKVILWASLECTNFSKAKGGMPRDADSRTLADHLHPYITCLNPDYVQIENVVEFMSWGPLDTKGKPISKKNGQDWLRWRKSICALGYRDEWKEMNSADFGALTSRNRLFGCFAKNDLPIVWPQSTHSKNPGNTSLVSPLKKWEPVKKALDFDDEGNSVFNRKKPLSTKTMQRLFMGCVKHIAGGKKNFMMQSHGGLPSSKVYSTEVPSRVITTTDNQHFVNACFIDKAYSGKPEDKNSSIESPAPTITTKPHESLVKACFIQKYNSNRQGSGGNNGHSVNEPSPVITTQGRLAIAQAHFLTKYHGTGENHLSVNEPASTLSTKDRLAKVQASFIDLQFSNGKQHQSIESPLGAITTVPKSNLVTADKWLMNTSFNNVGSSLDDPAPVITADRHAHYIINPSCGGNSGSVDAPCHVVIARQDKAPLYLITCNEGTVNVPVYDGDCEWTIKLKEFMALYGIADIKMRMLKVPELKRIQGFPDGYVLMGNQSDQKKFIGNSVHPYVPEHWIIAFSNKLFPDTWLTQKAA